MAIRFAPSKFEKLPMRKRRINAALMITAWLGLSVWGAALYSLDRQGTVTTGRLVRKYLSEAGHSTTYNLEYEFSPAPGKTVTGSGFAREEFYSKLNPNDTIQVRYLQSDPRVSHPWDGNERAFQVRLRAIFVFWVLGLFAIRRMLKLCIEPEKYWAGSSESRTR